MKDSAWKRLEIDSNGKLAPKHSSIVINQVNADLQRCRKVTDRA